MWVRAVAAALAVWGVSSAVMAAGYAEVWNPPEASGHVAAKPARKKPGVVKAKVGAGVRMDAAHGPRGPHKAAKLASATVHGAEKTATHGGAKKVSSRRTASGVRHLGVNTAVNSGTGVGNAKPKATVLARVKKPHPQLVRAKAPQGKVVRADLAHPARPHAVGLVAKSRSARPAVSHPSVNTPVASANFSSGSANASTNPAMASSGSLPPILR